MEKERKVPVNGRRVAEIRLAMPGRPSQLKLARKMGMSQGWLSPIEGGDNHPTEAQARKIAAALGVSYAALFEEPGSPVEWLAPNERGRGTAAERVPLGRDALEALAKAVLGETRPTPTAGLTFIVNGETITAGWIEVRDGQDWFVNRKGAWPLAALNPDQVLTMSELEPRPHRTHTATTPK